MSIFEEAHEKGSEEYLPWKEEKSEHRHLWLGLFWFMVAVICFYLAIS